MRWCVAKRRSRGQINRNGLISQLITDDMLGVPRPHPNEPVHVDITISICERFIFANKDKNRVGRFMHADTLQELSRDTRVRIYPGKLAPLIDL